jgi:hypothetical protein
MKTKRIYWIGLVLISLLWMKSPLEYLIFGKKTTGVVVQIDRLVSHSAKGGVTYVPLVEFSVNDLKYTFNGTRNYQCKVGDALEVVYLENSTQKPKINSFTGIFFDGFSDSFISPFGGLIFSLLVWIAFFNSFKNVFDNSRFLDLLRSKSRPRPSIKSDLPDKTRYGFKLILCVFLLLFIIAFGLLIHYFIKEKDILFTLIISGVSAIIISLLIKEIRKF